MLNFIQQLFEAKKDINSLKKIFKKMCFFLIAAKSCHASISQDNTRTLCEQLIKY